MCKLVLLSRVLLGQWACLVVVQFRCGEMVTWRKLHCLSSLRVTEASECVVPGSLPFSVRCINPDEMDLPGYLPLPNLIIKVLVVTCVRRMSQEKVLLPSREFMQVADLLHWSLGWCSPIICVVWPVWGAHRDPHPTAVHNKVVVWRRGVESF